MADFPQRECQEEENRAEVEGEGQGGGEGRQGSEKEEEVNREVGKPIVETADAPETRSQESLDQEAEACDGADQQEGGRGGGEGEGNPGEGPEEA